MTGASKLIGRIFARELPVRALYYALLNRMNLLLGTGDRRFEFERLYLENPDPWDFRGSVYERAKYQRVLKRIGEFRRSSERVLEIGCSIGIFSRMLASQFSNLVAVDFSAEALAKARQCCGGTNVSFIDSNLLSLDVPGKFNVIVCAEVLYYLALPQRAAACRQLLRFLAPDGILVMVSPEEGAPDVWEQALAGEFKTLFREVVRDDKRPYKIVIFMHK